MVNKSENKICSHFGSLSIIYNDNFIYNNNSIRLSIFFLSTT